VPTIFAPGNIDFLVAGPMEDALVRFPGKRYHIHNAALTAVRSEAEVAALPLAAVVSWVPLRPRAQDCPVHRRRPRKQAPARR